MRAEPGYRDAGGADCDRRADSDRCCGGAVGKRYADYEDARGGTSPDLKLVMKQQVEDPRTGETTVELKEFSRAELDPALFRVPPGYTVKTVL